MTAGVFAPQMHQTTKTPQLKESFMRVSISVVGGIALLAACTAYADITTIDPASFASGQYVSYATAGVTLSTMTLVPVETLPSEEILYGTNLAPVYAFDGAFTTTPDGPD
jgi:predicted benzoate:H+ symporter BenE